MLATAQQASVCQCRHTMLAAAPQAFQRQKQHVSNSATRLSVTVLKTCVKGHQGAQCTHVLQGALDCTRAPAWNGATQMRAVMMQMWAATMQMWAAMMQMMHMMQMRAAMMQMMHMMQMRAAMMQMWQPHAQAQ
eukprot:1148406-Pelagomonas_calceolata.AAC.5